jgi:hypothetical protein
MLRYQYLFDSNIYIDAIKCRPESLLGRFKENEAYLVISSISAGSRSS